MVLHLGAMLAFLLFEFAQVVVFKLLSLTRFFLVSAERHEAALRQFREPAQRFHFEVAAVDKLVHVLLVQLSQLLV